MMQRQAQHGINLHTRDLACGRGETILVRDLSLSVPPGEALLLRMPATRAKYQAVQLTDMWFASLEYGNQVSSLNTKQSVLSPDGAYYYVISQKDPGFANWLDAGALSRGTFLLRWDGVRGDLPENEFPEARRISLAEVAGAIPGLLVASAQGVDTLFWTVLLYLAVQQIESNLITPLVQREVVSVPPALFMLSVVAMGALFGVVGVLLAGPLTVAAYALVRALYVEGVLDEEIDSSRGV